MSTSPTTLAAVLEAAAPLMPWLYQLAASSEPDHLDTEVCATATFSYGQVRTLVGVLGKASLMQEAQPGDAAPARLAPRGEAKTLDGQTVLFFMRNPTDKNFDNARAALLRLETRGSVGEVRLETLRGLVLEDAALAMPKALGSQATVSIGDQVMFLHEYVANCIRALQPRPMRLPANAVDVMSEVLSFIRGYGGGARCLDDEARGEVVAAFETYFTGMRDAYAAAPTDDDLRNETLEVAALLMQGQHHPPCYLRPADPGATTVGECGNCARARSIRALQSQPTQMIRLPQAAEALARLAHRCWDGADPFKALEEEAATLAPGTPWERTAAWPLTLAKVLSVGSQMLRALPVPANRSTEEGRVAMALRAMCRELGVLLDAAGQPLPPVCGDCQEPVEEHRDGGRAEACSARNELDLPPSAVGTNDTLQEGAGAGASEGDEASGPAGTKNIRRVIEWALREHGYTFAPDAEAEVGAIERAAAGITRAEKVSAASGALSEEIIRGNWEGLAVLAAITREVTARTATPCPGCGDKGGKKGGAHYGDCEVFIEELDAELARRGVELVEATTPEGWALRPLGGAAEFKPAEAFAEARRELTYNVRDAEDVSSPGAISRARAGLAALDGLEVWVQELVSACRLHATGIREAVRVHLTHNGKPYSWFAVGARDILRHAELLVAATRFRLEAQAGGSKESPKAPPPVDPNTPPEAPCECGRPFGAHDKFSHRVHEHVPGLLGPGGVRVVCPGFRPVPPCACGHVVHPDRCPATVLPPKDFLGPMTLRQCPCTTFKCICSGHKHQQVALGCGFDSGRGASGRCRCKHNTPLRLVKPEGSA